MDKMVSLHSVLLSAPSLAAPQGLLQQAAKSQLVAKTLQQDHSAEVSEMSLAEGEAQCSQGPGRDGLTIGRSF
jgi:hypothetical protein